MTCSPRTREPSKPKLYLVDERGYNELMTDRAPYHNKDRTHNEEELRRTMARQRGEWLDDLKTQYRQWCILNAKTEAEMTEGVDVLDNVQEMYEELAEAGVPDDRPRRPYGVPRR